jgi:SPP1 gp7 family putative phage head morphogenesis protein
MVRRLIDQNPRREQRRQSALLDRLTVQFRGRLTRELEAAMREMVTHWEMTGNIILPRGFYERIETTYRQMALASVTMFGSRVFEQGKAHGFKLKTKETKESFAQIMTRLALRYIEQEMIRRRITAVTETTRQQIVNVVRKGYDDGLGQRDIAKMIEPLLPQLAAYRADAIARTETHGAANYGSQEAAKQTGVPMKKEWLASYDDRTRDTHREANGQTAGMDDTFTVGDSQLQFPGDPAGDPEEVINCRCSLGYIVDEEALEALL